MSRYTGNIITQSPTTPTGPFATSRAPGIWRLDDVAYWTQQGLWPNAANVPDPYFPNVSMLLSTTSLNNATNNLFVDSSGAFNPVSRFGNPTQGTLSPYGSNWANYFDGTGDNLSISSFPAGLSFGTDDFTIEFWTFPYSSPNNNWSPFFTMGNNGGGQEIRIGQNINGTGWGWLYPNNSNNADVYAGYGTLPINTWHHIAMTRSGSTMRLFLNGAVVATNTSVSFNFTNTTLLRVAMPQPAYADGTYNGYISNLRIVKGTALYTSAFTPSTTPLTAVSGTGLLTCQSNRFRDASSLANTITVNGDPKVIDFGPFSPSSLLAYNQNDVSNWSNYFNGTNSRMSIADNAAFGFGTGSFTVEFWLYYTGGNGYKFFFVNNSGSGNYVGYGLQTGTLTPWVWNGTDVLVASSNITPNSWQHHALVRNGSTLTIYLNGTAIGSTTWTVDLGASRPFLSAGTAVMITNQRREIFQISV